MHTSDPDSWIGGGKVNGRPVRGGRSGLAEGDTASITRPADNTSDHVAATIARRPHPKPPQMLATVYVKVAPADVDGAGFLTHAGRRRIQLDVTGMPPGGRLTLDVTECRHPDLELLRTVRDELRAGVVFELRARRADHARLWRLMYLDVCNEAVIEG
ncbi:hypothetical protein ACQBAR_07255 [Propionibacteriaceae bacterium Y1685]